MSTNPLYARISGLSIAPLTAFEAEHWCASRHVSPTEGERIWKEALGDERRADVIWQDEDWWLDRLNPIDDDALQCDSCDDELADECPDCTPRSRCDDCERSYGPRR